MGLTKRLYWSGCLSTSTGWIDKALILVGLSKHFYWWDWQSAYTGRVDKALILVRLTKRLYWQSAYIDNSLILTIHLYWQSAYIDKALILTIHLYWQSTYIDKALILTKHLYWQSTYIDEAFILTKHLYCVHLIVTEVQSTGHKALTLCVSYRDRGTFNWPQSTYIVCFLSWQRYIQLATKHLDCVFLIVTEVHSTGHKAHTLCVSYRDRGTFNWPQSTYIVCFLSWQRYIQLATKHLHGVFLIVTEVHSTGHKALTLCVSYRDRGTFNWPQSTYIVCFWSWQRYILLATKHLYCVFLIVTEVHSTSHKALILCVSYRDRGTFYWPQSTYIVFLIVTEVHSIGHKALILCVSYRDRGTFYWPQSTYIVFLIVTEVHSIGHKALILCVSHRDRGTFYWPQSTYIVFLIVTEVHSIGHKALTLRVSDRDRGTFYWPQSTYIVCFWSWQRYILLATKHLHCVFLIVTEVHSIGHKALILCVSDHDRGTFYWPQSTYIVCFWSWQRYILLATKHLHCVFLIVTEVHSIGHKALILCVSYRDRGTFYWPQSTYIVCFLSWQRYILLATKHLYCVFLIVTEVHSIGHKALILCVSYRDRGTFYWPQSTYIVFLIVTEVHSIGHKALILCVSDRTEVHSIGHKALILCFLSWQRYILLATKHLYCVS